MSTPPPRRRHGAHRKRSSIGRRVGTLLVALVVLAVCGVLIDHFVANNSPKLAGSSSTTTTRPPTKQAPPPTASSTTSTSTTTTTTPVSTTTTVAPLAPSNVLVEVLNGVGILDRAGQVADALKAIGFQINGTTDALSFDHTTNIVAYEPGSEAAAEAVADHIVGSTVLQADSTITNPNEVELVVGSDYSGVTNT